MQGRWWLAAVRPQGKREGTWVLPKGLIDNGETSPEAAVREGYEETGLRGRLSSKLGDVRYVYTWDGERIFKIVSFYLAFASSGRIGEVPEGMEVEVADVRWLPLAEGPQLLTHKGEREMAASALETLAGDPL